jgi:hypothetical protein
MDRKDTDHGSTPGGGTRNPNAALSGAVAQLNSALDVIAGIDPATLSEFGLGEDAVALLRVRRRVDAATAMVNARFSHGSEWSAYRQPEHCLAAQVSDPARAIRGAREWSFPDRIS